MSSAPRTAATTQLFLIAGSHLKLKAIDFSHPAAAALGDQVVAVSRLGKEYDSTAYFETTRISGEITRPRKAWVIDHGLPTLGLPLFSPAGGVLGILAMVDPGLAEADSGTDSSFSMAMSMLTRAHLRRVLSGWQLALPQQQGHGTGARNRAPARAPARSPPTHRYATRARLSFQHRGALPCRRPAASLYSEKGGNGSP